MKKYSFIILTFVAMLAGIYALYAQSTESAKYEFAIVKWDGPDRLYYNLPDKFELVHLRSQRVQMPREAQEEEWCLTYAANEMAKQGWETLNIDSRRILLRRARK